MNTAIEVASNAERACAGYAGAVICESRGVTYRIGVLCTGVIIDPTRNGVPDPALKWPTAVIKRLAKIAAVYFPPTGKA